MAIAPNSQNGVSHQQSFQVASTAQYNLLNYCWKKNSKDQLMAPTTGYTGNTTMAANQQPKQVYSSSLGTNSNTSGQKRTKVFYNKKP